jgi:hypothetical protein
MGLHVYCIVPAVHPPPAGLSGVDGSAVTLVTAHDLGLWVSQHDSAPAPALEAVRVHNEVVQAAMGPEVTPVPVRFGQWLDDAAAAAARLDADRDRWAERLATFRGRAEYGVAIALPVAAEADTARDVRPAPPGTGRAYMQALARRQAAADARKQTAEDVAADVAARVGSLAADRRVELNAAGAVIVRIAHLVASADADAYHGVMREVGAMRQDVQIHLTGPWPPYSFA